MILIPCLVKVAPTALPAAKNTNAAAASARRKVPRVILPGYLNRRGFQCVRGDPLVRQVGELLEQGEHVLLLRDPVACPGGPWADLHGDRGLRQSDEHV